MDNNNAVFEAVLQMASAYAPTVKDGYDVNPARAEAARQQVSIINASLLADAVVSLHRIARALESFAQAAQATAAEDRNDATRVSTGVLS